jgi:hypothetical protein
MSLIRFPLSIYIINKYNNNFSNILEFIFYTNFLVSGASICFSYIINNLQSQYLISPETYEIFNNNLISLYKIII